MPQQDGLLEQLLRSSWASQQSSKKLPLLGGKNKVVKWACTGPQTPPSNPPRPPLLRGRFGIDLTSIRHRNRLNQEIDAETMSNRC